MPTALQQRTWSPHSHKSCSRRYISQAKLSRRREAVNCRVCAQQALDRACPNSIVQVKLDVHPFLRKVYRPCSLYHGLCDSTRIPRSIVRLQTGLPRNLLRRYTTRIYFKRSVAWPAEVSDQAQHDRRRHGGADLRLLRLPRICRKGVRPPGNGRGGVRQPGRPGGHLPRHLVAPGGLLTTCCHAAAALVTAHQQQRCIHRQILHCTRAPGSHPIYGLHRTAGSQHRCAAACSHRWSKFCGSRASPGPERKLRHYLAH